MSDEAIGFVLTAVVLVSGMAALGARVAGRLPTTPWRIVVAAVLAAFGLGALGGRPLAVGVATMVWALVIAATVAVVQQMRTEFGIVAGVLGGAIAVQSAITAFVILRFDAFTAPRDEAHLWLPAMFGAVRRLGGPVNERRESPFWVQLSSEANVLPWLFLLLTSFILAFAVRRSVGSRRSLQAVAV